MTAPSRWHSWWLGAAAVAAVVAALARPLPPHGFVSGDQGVKLIAARNAIAHPSRAFDIDLPTIHGRAVPAMDQMFRVHGTHAHSLQSPLFPVLTAPLVAAFGLRGAYVLPVLSFAALLPLAWAIARRTSAETSRTALVISAVLASPLFFYALEFWEHVPAAAVLAASTALALDRGSGRWVPVTAGVLAAVGVLLRPEAIWYVAILTYWSGPVAARVQFGSGLVAVLMAFAGLNYLESGSLLGPHADAALSTLFDRWAYSRLERAEAWLMPTTSPLTWAAVALAVLAWTLYRRNGTNAARDTGVVAALLLAVSGVAEERSADLLWHAWPLGGLALLPRALPSSMRPLVWLAVGTSALVWLTSTHNGGAQWGPRILLVSAPALLVLAAHGWDAAVALGPRRMLRIGAVLLITATGVWTSRAAYVDLRGWKRYYGSLVARVGELTQPGGYIVTNVWWLDQICAPLYGTRTFLVVDSPAETTEVLRQLDAAGVRRIHLAWSAEPDHPGPIVTDGTCYRAQPPTALTERRIHIADAVCAD